jgi:hypothetical protein
MLPFQAPRWTRRCILERVPDDSNYTETMVDSAIRIESDQILESGKGFTISIEARE